MTNIILIKTLPTSLIYTLTATDIAAGYVTINLKNFEKLSITSKNDPLKIQIPKTKSSQNSSPTDMFNNMVVDLKKITQLITFTGWLDDDDTETAWNKYWKLVAMQTRGGPLTSLTIGTSDKLIFPTSDGVNPSVTPVYPTTTAQAFLTSVKGDIESDDTGDITASFSAKPARIKVDLEIYLGYER